tara:strand:+ start:2794 stop:3045 length:252 start_codon:yes stop_codon:yes gene_type:complete
MAKSKEERLLDEKISIRIKSLREQFESNQSKFAKDNLIDRQLISRWENRHDERGISIHSISKFCRMVNISLKDFFDHESFKNR